MIEYKYFFKVAYPDTDQMGTVHHDNCEQKYKKE